MGTIKAGAASRDITPARSQFLYGYPFVDRYSEGVHDPLMSSALYISDGSAGGETVFIANDIVGIDKQLATQIRRRISDSTGVPANSILVSATHTHSGPITSAHASTRNDPVIPPADEEYRSRLADQIVAAGTSAVDSAVSAAIGIVQAHAEGVGTNRRDPAGPSDPEVPVLVARDRDDSPIACMLVYSMHPTVLHEDSRLISGDFPAFTRRYLCDRVFNAEIPVLHHCGTAGDQSPRHVTSENSFAEADRLGRLLGKAVGKALESVRFHTDWTVRAAGKEIDLPRKCFPTVREATRGRDEAKARLEKLRHSGAPRQEIRTAETDWFGAEETLTFAQLNESGELTAYYDNCLPAEVQAIGVGPYAYVAMPGELFVEYGLELKKRCENAYPITLANGDLQGYIVTEEAVDEGGYEASNALFQWRSGGKLIETAVDLVDRIRSGS